MIIRSKRKPKKVKVDLIKEATHWFGEKLLSKRLNQKIILNLKFTDNLNKETGCIAFCSWLDKNHKPREFEFEIDSNLNEQEMLRAVAHEMVHLKQYATGQIKDFARTDKIKWEGKILTAKNDADAETYWFSPWEIEAYGKEVGLYALFKIYRKQNLKRK